MYITVNLLSPEEGERLWTRELGVPPAALPLPLLNDPEYASSSTQFDTTKLSRDRLNERNSKSLVEELAKLGDVHAIADNMVHPLGRALLPYMRRSEQIYQTTVSSANDMILVYCPIYLDDSVLDTDLYRTSDCKTRSDIEEMLRSNDLGALSLDHRVIPTNHIAAVLTVRVGDFFPELGEKSIDFLGVVRNDISGGRLGSICSPDSSGYVKVNMKLLTPTYTVSGIPVTNKPCPAGYASLAVFRSRLLALFGQRTVLGNLLAMKKHYTLEHSYSTCSNSLFTTGVFTNSMQGQNKRDSVRVMVTKHNVSNIFTVPLDDVRFFATSKSLVYYIMDKMIFNTTSNMWITSSGSMWPRKTYLLGDWWLLEAQVSKDLGLPNQIVPTVMSNGTVTQTFYCQALGLFLYFLPYVIAPPRPVEMYGPHIRKIIRSNSTEFHADQFDYGTRLPTSILELMVSFTSNMLFIFSTMS